MVLSTPSFEIAEIAPPTACVAAVRLPRLPCNVEPETWTSALDGLDATRVRVRIDLDILEQREEARAYRVLGMARWQYDKVHRFVDYDVVVDTGVLDPDAAADALYAFITA